MNVVSKPGFAQPACHGSSCTLLCNLHDTPVREVAVLCRRGVGLKQEWGGGRWGGHGWVGGRVEGREKSRLLSGDKRYTP